MDVNKEVLSLWGEYYKQNSAISEEMELVPMFYHKSEHTPKKEIRVLSVGFNPSYVENNYKKAPIKEKQPKQKSNDIILLNVSDRATIFKTNYIL